jgi:hypothetical protein
LQSGRVQDAALTALLALAIAERATSAVATRGVRRRVWLGDPLVIASGGWNAYLAALHLQAGEDFAWVSMLWADPTPRHAALAVYQTLVLPWASMPLAVCLAIPALAGACVMALRERRALVALVLATVPYAVLHLLFQQTTPTRCLHLTAIISSPRAGWHDGPLHAVRRGSRDRFPCRCVSTRCGLRREAHPACAIGCGRTGSQRAPGHL